MEWNGSEWKRTEVMNKRWGEKERLREEKGRRAQIMG